MEKNNRARVLTRRDHRSSNVAAYATIENENARNEATRTAAARSSASHCARACPAVRL
jgi:hypothetical protein